VKYLALRTGHEFVRINNHAHTDVQEYLGTYVSNSMGNLVFQEGPLVTAVRKGHWVVLDELNLAPSEVLEMLNRLLDDNRELMIPDTQEVIKPHSDFAVFATQNPTGVYDSISPLYWSFLKTLILPPFECNSAEPGTEVARNFQGLLEAGFLKCMLEKSLILNS
jgi:midasin